MEGQTTELRDTRIEFTGSGREYFGIWIVNILLTIITLGIYSAWARVRTRKYFYNNTCIDGAVFDYHANPVAILKGWAIVAVLLIVQQVLVRIHYFYGMGMLIILLAFIPWALVRSRVFNLLNTSYRNVRFHFDRNYKGMYGIFLVTPVIIAAGYFLILYTMLGAALNGTKPSSTLIGVSGILMLLGVVLLPYFMFLFYRFVVDHSAYGRTYFKSHLSAGRFYMIYLQAFGLLLLMLIVVAIVAMILSLVFSIALHTSGGSKDGIGGVILSSILSLLSVTGFYYVRFFVQAKKLNEIWGKTTIAGHRISSHLKPLALMWVISVNILLIVVTLGLYIPWAKVRILRYRLDNIVLQVDGELDNFVANEAEQMGAVGMELGEAMDFVISL